MKIKKQGIIISVVIIATILSTNIGTKHNNTSASQGETYKETSNITEPKNTTTNNDIPGFTAEELKKEPFEYYSELDNLGRCRPCMAMIDKSIMPTEQRGYIGNIKPSGWVQKKYKTESTHSDSAYLYNRCHLIAYCLAGENDNPKNLITGTRQLNLNMLKYEDLVCNYIKRTNDKVLYRVTPIFEGDNLLCSGVRIEAQSINSNEISFNVFIPNIEDNVIIDYKTGNSSGDIYE